MAGSPGADHDNLRTVLDWLESAGRTQEALQLAGALYRFWSMRGYLLEGRDRLERLLARERAGTSARCGRSTALRPWPRPRAIRDRREASRGGARPRAQLGDAWGEAYAVYMLGMAATEREDWSGALPFFEASLDAFRRLGDDHYVLLAMDGIAWIARMLGDREGGKRLHEETRWRPGQRRQRGGRPAALAARRPREQGGTDQRGARDAPGGARPEPR